MVTHEDKGFRKTVILNKTLRFAESDYLVFTDQDCVLRSVLRCPANVAQRLNFLLSVVKSHCLYLIPETAISETVVSKAIFVALNRIRILKPSYP